MKPSRGMADIGVREGSRFARIRRATPWRVMPMATLDLWAQETPNKDSCFQSIEVRMSQNRLANRIYIIEGGTRVKPSRSLLPTP